MIQSFVGLLVKFRSHAMVKRFVLFACTLLVSGSFCSELRAQSFLDKLEKAVRNQVSEAASSKQDPQATSDELPAPKPSSRSSKPPAATTIPRIGSAPSSNDPVVPQPRGAQGSILANPSQQAPSSGGQIYLGLEAEEPIGAGIGVRVSAVTEGSPAWKAGLKVGDRILAVNGFAVGKINDMAVQLGKTRPGDTLRLLVSRAGRNFPLTAVLMDASLANRIAAKAGPGLQTPSPAYVAGPPYVGLTVNDLTSSFRNQFGISVFRGAAVSGVAKGSPAAAAGIRAGDAVIELGGYAIESAKQLQDRVSQLKPGEKVEFLYYRGSIARLVEIVVGNVPGSGSVMSQGSSTMRQSNPALLPEPPSPGIVGSNMVPPEVQIAPKNDATAGALNSILDLGSLTPVESTRPSPAGVQADQNLPREAAGDAQVKKLEAENGELMKQNDQLRKELARVNGELKTTQAKLEQILELLKQR